VTHKAQPADGLPQTDIQTVRKAGFVYLNRSQTRIKGGDIMQIHIASQHMALGNRAAACVWQRRT
jgi:hypothetical protein